MTAEEIVAKLGDEQFVKVGDLPAAVTEDWLTIRCMDAAGTQAMRYLLRALAMQEHERNRAWTSIREALELPSDGELLALGVTLQLQHDQPGAVFVRRLK